MKKAIRNIPTAQFLLLLAQANSINCPYVDLTFDTVRRSVTIIPISRDESMERFNEGKDGTDIEDLINET